ncbi:MAG: hypothetical protein H6741_20830 [Alphaproteobacteria bacterium]|nr:hypothetical protein [Alphaproteobacteria bacterium]
MQRRYRFIDEGSGRCRLEIQGPSPGLGLESAAAEAGAHPEHRHYAHALRSEGRTVATLYSDVDEPWGLIWGEERGLPAPDPAWMQAEARAEFCRWAADRGLELGAREDALISALPPDLYTALPLRDFMRRPTLLLRDGAVQERGQNTALVVAAEIDDEERDTWVTVEAAVPPGAGFGQLMLGVAVMDYPFDQPDRAHLLLLGLDQGGGGEPMALVPESGALVVPCSAMASGESGLMGPARLAAADWRGHKREAVLRAIERL